MQPEISPDDEATASAALRAPRVPGRTLSSRRGESLAPMDEHCAEEVPAPSFLREDHSKRRSQSWAQPQPEILMRGPAK
jgi:hypothetical protein